MTAAAPGSLDESKRKHSLGLSSLDIPHIPLRFDNEAADESALKLVEAYAPDWKGNEDGSVVLVRFTEGITNTLTKASKNRPGKTTSEIDRDAILLRAYGRGTDILIDRRREIKAHNALAKRGLAPQLLARFDNGLMYRFVEGEVCTPQDLRRHDVYRQIAKRLGQWHAVIPITEISTSDTPDVDGLTASRDRDTPLPNIWSVVQQWLQALPARTEKEVQLQKQLNDELAYLRKRFGRTAGLLGKDFVFGHCDLLSGNVIMQQHSSKSSKSNGASDAQLDNHSLENDEPTVSFIDYEYTTPAPAAFDIANHFAEWAGFDCDHSGCPTRSQRLEFLKYYADSFFLHASRIDATLTIDQHHKDAAIQTLSDQVDDYRGIPGFYWGIWALIQADISQIDFNYAEYAQIRLGEYWAWKEESDGSRLRAGKHMSAREKRWAEP